MAHLRLAAILLAAAAFAGEQVTISIDPARRGQVWEGAGSCLATWAGIEKVYLGERWQRLFAEDLGFTVLRIDLLPIVLGPDGRHYYKPVEFSPDQQRNLAFFDYSSPRNVRMTTYAAVAKALARRVPELTVVATVWTPPHWMKRGARITNGGNDSGGGTLDLSPANLEQYARYLAAAVLAFERAAGVPVHALSIANEPLFEQTYNSMKLTPEQYVKAFVPVAREFQRLGMKTRFFGPESVIYGAPPKDTWLIDQQIDYCRRILADPEAAKAMHAFAAHGYGGDGVTSDRKGSGHWAHYWSPLRASGKRSWMTETGGGDPRRALTTFPAAVIEGMLQGDLSMWVTWQVNDGAPLSEHTLVGRDLDQPTVKSAVARHLFRWIRPGAQRLATAPDIVPGRFSVTAWSHEKRRTLTISILNLEGGRNLVVRMPAGATSPLRVLQSTADGLDRELQTLKPADGRVELAVPAMSLTTLTSEPAGNAR